jgi:hypothetical protein
MSDELYEVSQYSEKELFDILDLVNPSDRELEAKILMMIRKYEQEIPNPSMVLFFEDIYSRFFEDSDSSEGEDDNSDDDKEGFVTIEGMKNNTASKKPKRSINSAEIIKEAGITPPPKAIDTTTTEEKAGTVAIKDNKGESDKVVQTTSFQYTKGKLNPVLKETITRTMTLDSKFRDRKLYKNATSYTINLSETLHNVVALRFFAIHIPYTWYNVTNDYGANFFLLKGISPGINDGNSDIKISIPPGHYENNTLVTAISDAIQNYKLSHKNINLGSTDIVFNYSNGEIKKPDSGKATFIIDIKNIYDATNYMLRFPTWSNPYGSLITRSKSIPGFLGFAQQKYIPNSIYSNIKQSTAETQVITPSGQPVVPKLFDLDLVFDIYFKDTITGGVTYNQNNYITILNYQDPNNTGYNPPIEITANEQQGSSELTLVSGVLSNSYVGAEVTGPGIPDGTTVTEVDISTGILTISAAALTSDLGATITIISSKVMDTITVTLSSSAGVLNPDTVSYYTRTDLIMNLNKSLQSNPQLTKDSSISIVDVSYNDVNGNTVTYQKFKLSITLNRSTTTQQLNMKQIVQFPDETTNKNPVWSGFTSPSNSNSAFMFDTSLREINDLYSDTSPVFLNYEITSSPTIQLTCITTPDPANNYLATIPNGTYTKNTYINAIKTALLTDIGSSPDVMLDLNIYDDPTTGKFTLEISFYKTLPDGSHVTELDYEITFIDAASNTWANYLILSQTPYVIRDYNVTGSNFCRIVANGPIKDEMIQIDSTNNKFDLAPQPTVSGLYTATGANTVSITIPNGYYTKSQLYAEINSQLQADPISSGSSIQSIWDSTGTEYVKFRPNINKIYTSEDYNLTFYNFEDYVSCLVTPSGQSTLTPIPWAGTLGWMLGFHSNQVYNLSNQTEYVSTNDYTYDPDTQIITISSDTPVNTNNITNFYLTVEDYAQNHINDGIVTISKNDTSIQLPSYTSLATAKCNPVALSKNKKQLSYDSALDPNQLITVGQFYSASTQLNEAVSVDTSNLTNSTGASINNVLSVVFLTKLPAWGQPHVDNGGQNLNQDRKYFGPVNISRITLQLITDIGYLVDLNGADWSVTLLCDSLYTAH